MTSNGKKLQKSPSGNTALDKESIVELMKTVFEEELAKQQQLLSWQNSSSYQKLLKTTWQLRSKKLESYEKR